MKDVMIARCMVLLLVVVMPLGGCGHHDAVGTIAGWEHRHQGGAISQQRSPPPGLLNPYPHVGLTPQQAVDVPSAAARQLLTEKLTQERNFGQWLAVSDGSLFDAPPTRPQNTRASLPQRKLKTSSEASMQMDVASPSHESSKVRQEPKSFSSGNHQDASQERILDPSADPSFDWKMPRVTTPISLTQAQAHLPDTLAQPPMLPQIPGFPLPDARTAFEGVQRPDLDLRSPHGTLIRFSPSSDRMRDKQEKALSDLERVRGQEGNVFIRGYGNATSFSPDEQCLGLLLGLLRAERVASAFVADGVPPRHIWVSAAPYGHGARISLSPY